MNPENWNGWLWAYLALMAFSWVANCLLHGQPRASATYNGWAATVGFAGGIFLLYMIGALR